MEWIDGMTSAAIVPAPTTPTTTTTIKNAVDKLNSTVTEDALAFVTHAVPIITSGWGPVVVMPIYAREI